MTPSKNAPEAPKEPSAVEPDAADETADAEAPAEAPSEEEQEAPAPSHPAEKLFRNAEDQLQALLDSGLLLSDIELVTDAAGRLIEAKRAEL